MGSIHSLQTFLNDKFRIKSLSDLKYFFCIEVARSNKGIFICQRKYALVILVNSGILGVKLVKIFMDQNLRLSKDLGLPLSPIHWQIALSYKNTARYLLCRLKSQSIHGCSFLLTSDCCSESPLVS